MHCDVDLISGDAAAQAYLEEMAAMLIQAQGDGNTQAGQRLQRLTTELVRAPQPSPGLRA